MSRKTLTVIAILTLMILPTIPVFAIKPAGPSSTNGLEKGKNDHLYLYQKDHTDPEWPITEDPAWAKMNINTKKDELDFANTVGGQPTILTKKASTNVLLFDGQTTVIGGLSKEKIDKGESGLPWLKDIPILGYLFKSQRTSDAMDEVLIFITPHILGEQLMEGLEEAPLEESSSNEASES